ncbi:hypothetical protein [Ramlibacter sp.]|uniref:hypothetical protein n=1 Tax=Ramlibacter sp. TaxID=1917967 RepID=UPI002FCBBC71
MPAIRILLAWLLLAALPLQGFAAATTLLCGPAHHGPVAAAGSHHATADGHDHGQDHGHGHAAAPHADAPGAGAEAATLSSIAAGHSCNLCSAACHGVGLASQPAEVGLADAPRVPLTEAFRGFDSRPAPVPDKPPRA